MEKFEFKTGEVILNDFDFEDDKLYAEQMWSFKEDILQVRFKSVNVLDLGWYPEFDLEDGCFKLVVVKIDDWLNPIFCKTTKSIKEVRHFITEAVEIAERLE